ncbi:MAG: methyl-accepting chemotaxis protein [Treponemataceae bacterium]|nr:methyl-accepting chemotaxis protein [Treponemataceae bacterium]
MKLNTKFVILISSFVIVTMGVAVGIFASFSSIRQMQKFEQETSKMELLIEEIYAYPPTVLAIRANMGTLVSDWQDLSTKAKTQMDNISSPKYRSMLNEEENEYLETLLKVWKVIAPQLDKVEAALKEFTDLSFSKLETLSMESNGITQTIMTLDDEDSRKTIMTYMINRITQSTSVLMDSNDTFSKVLAQLSVTLTERNNKMFRTFVIQNIIILLIASIIVFVIALTVTRRITWRVKALQNASTKLAQKDFTVDISDITKGKDEISSLATTLSDTIRDLRSFLEVVKDSSYQNVSLGENISMAAHDTASATHEIRSNIESLRKQFDDIELAVVNSVDSLTRMSTAVMGLSKDNNVQTMAIQESDKASSKMALSVEKIRNMAEENCSSAEEMQEAVAYGDQKIEASNTMIREVANQIKGVAEIVDMINSIAEQTNILAMNAAIESAHAGESGKGFTVVAEEIRILAESTGENSKRISDSLFTIISRMREVTDYSESAAQAFADINGKSATIHRSLTQILDNISEVVGEAEKVAAFSQRITTASEKMDIAYENLNTQREAVSQEMEKLENVVAISRNGIDEIKIGAEDIVERMLSVNDMSAKNRTKMTALSDDLSQFRTSMRDFITSPAHTKENPENEVISKEELHDAIFGDDEIESKESLIEKAKQSLEEPTDAEQLATSQEAETVQQGEETDQFAEEADNQEPTLQDSNEDLSLNIPKEDTESEEIIQEAQSPDEQMETELEQEEAVQPKKHGLLNAGSAYIQEEKETEEVSPPDDFDTMFN